MLFEVIFENKGSGHRTTERIPSPAQVTIAGDASVDLIPWRVERVSHLVTEGDGRGVLAPPHTIRVEIA